MPILPIVTDIPSLRKKSLPFKENCSKLRDLITDLKETVVAQEKPPAVGLSAIQIGTPAMVFVTYYKNNTRVFINPVPVLYVDGTEYADEACLSLPGVSVNVPRYKGMVLSYCAIEKKILTMKRERFDGFLARVIQHELDHLDGRLITDYTL